jgi:hypothetical protein
MFHLPLNEDNFYYLLCIKLFIKECMSFLGSYVKTCRNFGISLNKKMHSFAIFPQFFKDFSAKNYIQ